MSRSINHKKPCLAGRYASFAVIAVRCNKDFSTGKKKLTKDGIYYLLDGYDVETGGKHVLEREEIDVLYDDYLNADNMLTPHVIVSAIVGQNGSGKSSIVEFMMRLINNFAAATFGELKTTPSTERLHFIKGIYGDLWFENDDTIHRLNVADDTVEIYKFERIDKLLQEVKIYSSTKTSNKEGEIFLRISDDKLKEIYECFFYTIVTNYSLYAYNNRDFEEEDDDENKIQLIRTLLKSKGEEKNATIPIERNWLTGVFHKNDGYQIPLVLTPFRINGNIDVNKENTLAKERLISLLLENKDFRTINGHLEVESLSLGRIKMKDYSFPYMRNDLGMKRLTQKGYYLLRAQIAKRWGELIDITIPLESPPESDKRYYDLALNYLAYKTIKVASKYRQHHVPFLNLLVFKEGFDEETVNKLVESEATDHSHITRKIFQTLAYLTGNVYSGLLTNENLSVLHFEEIMDRYRWNFDEVPEPDNDYFIIRGHLAQQAMFPPPFLDSRINLCEKGEKSVKITFESLSSGERQIAYVVSSILYHLDNVNSVADDLSDDLRIPYKNVFLVLEEVELYFHPELQQGLLKNILDGIKEIDFIHLKGIHILFVTHSPYVLSDIPKKNVLALENNGIPTEKKLNTFCANIHEMLEDSFFLSDGTQGYLAQWEIGRLMACMKIHKIFITKRHITLEDCLAGEADPAGAATIFNDLFFRYRDLKKKRKKLKFDYESFCCDFSADQLKERINIIDEPVIRAVLEHELNTMMGVDKNLRQQRIEELEREVRRLKEME